MNVHAIGFKIGFWSGLLLVVVGVSLTAYAAARMRDLAAGQRTQTLELSRQLVLQAAHQEAAAVQTGIADALTTARTLAQSFVPAAHKAPRDLTEDDWKRLATRFKRMEMASELALSAIQPLVEAAASGRPRLAEAQRQAIELVRGLRYDGDNYLWIQDRSQPVPRMIMHPLMPELDGKPLDDARFRTAQGRGENLFAALDAAVARSGSGHVHYDWPRPGTGEIQTKLSFGRLLPAWGWVLGTGLWVEDLEIQDRDDINLILRSVLRERPDLLGVYTGWEPDAFDGRDAAFVGTPGTDASGRFIPYWTRGADGALALEPLLDYETPGVGNYYLLPKSTKTEQVIDPFRYPVQGREVLMTSLVAPILVAGRFRGIAGVDITLDRFQVQADRTAAGLYGGQSTVAVIANDGTLVAVSGRPDLAGRALDALHDDWRENLAEIQAGRTILEEHDGQIIGFAPARFGQAATPWAVQVMVPVAEVTRQADANVAAARQANLVMMGVAAACVILGVLLMQVIARRIARPLQRVSDSLRQIAEGDGDLTRELDARGRDELAELARAFNVFQGRIRALIREGVAGSERVAATASQLSATSGETNEQVRRQQSETDQVATAMNEMTATVAEVARHAADAAQAARRADQEANTGREVVARTVGSIQSLSEQMEASTEAIAQLSRDAGEIGRILEVIGGVAEQTNLLALNAAIEAARAGEQGRGFAVVADEVRTLASRTQASTREIQEMIERLQSGVARAVRAMDEGRTKVRDSVVMAGDTAQSLEVMMQSVSTISDMNTQIASAAEEQSAVAAEIDRNIVNISQVVDRIATGSGQIDQAAGELARLAAEERRRMARFKV